jgi:hypothetical protein
MLFIHPMWDSENERLGLKTCTELGYTVRGIGDLVGFIGFISLIATPAYLVYRLLRDQFSAGDLWLLAVPFVVAIVGRVLYEIAWILVSKKNFQYDYETRTAKWVEKGCARVFPDSQQS